MEHSFLTPEQLAERDRRKVPFHVVINPTLIVEESETASFFEGCLSVPGYLGIVPRAKAVRVECLNEKGEPVVICAKGWHARILQHEIDHLNGTLYIDKAFKETVMTEENYDRLWKGKPIQEVCDSCR
jgi:peptide deformylase